MKQYLEEQLNALLSVGFASREDTALFKGIKHDDYVENLQQYLFNFGTWVETPMLKNVQGLNDRGIDLKAEFKVANYIVGFQVKSFNDIDAPDFSPKLWKQIGQSGSYPVDMLFVILCADMTYKSHYQKVRRFVAEIEQGNYPQITVIQPRQAWKLYQFCTQPIDPQQVQNRIHRNISRFLRAMGRTQELHNPHSLYFNLEQLYVPPAEYLKINRLLDEHNIVFIVGAPHLGKTFTAVRMLYDLYLKGYHPVWMFGRITSGHTQSMSLQEAYRQQDIRDAFSFESAVKAGFALYLEDPFGRTNLEELEFAGSLLRINELLHLLERRSNAGSMKPKVVVTSRESIFRRAAESQPQLSEYAVWLKTGMDDTNEQRISYNFGLRAQITEKYTHFYTPKWTEHSKEPSRAEIERIEEVLSLATSLLWTPHGIQHFFLTSKDMRLRDENEVEALRECVIQSENISESFANEIALLPRLQQLVFVVIYLTNHGKTGRDFWNRQSRNHDQYLALVQTLEYGMDRGQESWQQVLEAYPNIIELIENDNTRSKITDLVRFAHPAYGGAVSGFLSKHPDILETIFAHIQQLLQTLPGTHLTQDLVWLLPHWHQGRTSREAQILDAYLATNDLQLLITLAEKYNIRFAFTQNGSLKSAIRGIVQHPLAQGDNNHVRQIFVRAAHVVKEMSMENRCEILLLGLSNDPHLMGMAMHRPYDLVCRHYSEVTKEARDHLHHYLENNINARQVVGRSLGNYYDLLPSSLQQFADGIATDNSFSVYLAQKELITGFALGYGQYNKKAHHLINVMAKSDDQKTRAYLASALVPIYDQLDDNLRYIWDNLIGDDIPHCVIAVAERIISLSASQTQFDSLQQNGLLDFAFSCTESDSPVVRAEILRILIESRSNFHIDDLEAKTEGLLFDNEEIVMGAALYWMLNDSELQLKYQDRFQELLANNSVHVSFSKLLYYTNSQSKVSAEIEEQVSELIHTKSQFLLNALLFHIAAQQPFLKRDWDHWLEAQIGDNDEKDGILYTAKRHHPNDNKSRPIFEPNWLIDYEKPLELVWFYPQKSWIRMSTGIQAIVKKLDELTMIFHLKEKFPDYLDC